MLIINCDKILDHDNVLSLKINFSIHILFSLLLVLTSCETSMEYDIVLRNGTIIDGRGSERYIGDLAITKDRIVAVGEVKGSGRDEIDIRGKIVAPGFIDTHSHHDTKMFENTDMLAALSQGITTIFIGQDGSSNYPISDLRERLSQIPVSINIASFSGHNTLREKVMGLDHKRPAGDSEVLAMIELLRSDIEAGAWGLSSGLEYDPGIYSTTDEIISLAKIVSAVNGRYISHIRSEDRNFWSAIDEIIRIGRVARLPVQISHIKLAMNHLHGRADELLSRLNEARDNGVMISADIYPYTYWQSTMQVLFPDRDFNDRGSADLALSEITSPDEVIITQYDPEPNYIGKRLSEIAELRREHPSVTLMGLISETNYDDGSESIVAKSMTETDIIELLEWRYTNVCTDGGSDGGHPRGYGTYPRILGQYVREDRSMDLESAVHKMTGLPSLNMGLEDRGILGPGMAADVVVFDPLRIIDRATFEDPRALSEGIVRVIVNGIIVYADGRVNDDRPGRFLSGPGYIANR